MSTFTPMQKKVTELRGRDILVSAAAGSGKTTVLVERIIKKITNKDEPVDIDRILVVTFTRAAAKEMRERIRQAIDAALTENPGDERLMRQASYVFHSQITTIDSFCNYILKNYFHRVGAAPDFRIGDARELSLISTEVMDGLMEEYYGKKDEDFLRLIDCFSVRNRDDMVCDMIRSLYTAASATPWPKEWLADLLDDYDMISGDHGDDEVSMPEDWQPSWLFQVVDDARLQISESYDIVKGLLSMIDDEAPGHPYRSAIASDLSLIEGLLGCAPYEGLYDRLSAFSFERLSSKKYEDPWEGFRDGIKSARERYKDAISGIAADCFFQTKEELYLSMARVGKNVRTLVELTAEYGSRYLKKKLEKNVLDFSDVEHLALDILVDKSTKKPTDIALELREFYDEILIDEYQDSNYLQETILKTISREETGGNNYFMVGDVKQSIYAFRQARPEIFSGKYESFAKDDEGGLQTLCQRVDLDKNFRSRKEIIDAVNAVFLPLMEKSVGGVDYDDAATLKFGAEYYEEAAGCDYRAELLLAAKDDGESPDEAGADSNVPEGGIDAEGRMIAARIRELMGELKVMDKETGGPRALKYSDIVILMRGVKGRGADMMETLMSFGIPAHVTDESGYFETMEVLTILSLLSVLDNPRQDIPLAAVMRSPIFSFSDEELAKLRMADTSIPFYRAVFEGEISEDEKLLKKHAAFLSFIETYRKKLYDTSIHELLQDIMASTGYRTYVRALPGGDVRAANLDRLIELAVDYEKTSFKGCFQFVNYIRQLKKYQQDVGTADLIGEDDDAVRIMTIHKSKGLEFPVVFLSGVNRKFNMRDASGAFVLSPQRGLALTDVDPVRRVRSPYLYRTYLSKSIAADMIGEEMRVLYVAMTRAKEKLIITGTCKSDEDFADFGAALPGGAGNEKKLPYIVRINAGSYADFLYPSIFGGGGHFVVRRYDMRQLVENETAGAVKKLISRSDIETMGEGVSSGASGYDEELLEFSYPKAEMLFKAKYSVSELKHKSMEAYYDSDTIQVIPDFAGEGKADKGDVNTGAVKGTAMHLFMEHFDFASAQGESAVDEQIELMVERGHMTEEQAGLLDREKIKTFTTTELFGRMARAAGRGLLFVEQPFVMGDHPDELLGDYYPDRSLPSGDGSPMLLVQGIIDAFFVEDDGIVVVDYKTDRVKKAEELIGRYKKQMELYADALHRGFGKKVSQRIIYSFALDDEVIL